MTIDQTPFQTPSVTTLRRSRAARLAVAFVAASMVAAQPAPQKGPAKAPQVSDDGTKIAAPFASFSGLDKITGRIISFDVAIDETVQFGALQVTPRVCYERPATVAPLTTTFVEVDEITLDNKIRRIFTGWMYADSPGLHAVEHAVYDVWLTDCKVTTTDAAANAKAGTSDAAAVPAVPPAATPAAAPVPPSAPKPQAAPVAPPPAAVAPSPVVPKPPAPAAPAPTALKPPPAAAPGAPLPSRSELPPLPPLR